MPKVNNRYSTFNGGEISPESHGRVDLNKYQSSLKKAENFIIRPEGGAHRRAGTRHIHPAIDPAVKSRMIPFVFSTEQAYMLEFSDRKMRVYADEVHIHVPTQSTIPIVEEAESLSNEFHMVDHGYIHNQGPIQITASAGLPAGLALTTDYWIALPKAFNFTDADVAVATEIITVSAAHDYEDGQGPFRLITTGALPSPLSSNLDYYIKLVSPTTFQLSLTRFGAAVNLVAPLRGGTHSIIPTGDYSRDWFKLSDGVDGAIVPFTTDGTSPHEFTPEADMPLEVVIPFTEDELYDIHIAQSADILFMNHGNHRPSQLSRTGHTKWSFDFQNIIDGPYLVENTVTTSDVTASAVQGTDITLTLSSPTAIREGAGWASEDIGRLFRHKDTGNWGYVEITGIHETGTGENLIARGTVRQLLVGITTTSTWRLGAWYKNNYPKTLSFSDQRLWHGGETNSPQNMHGSRTGLYTDFAPTDPAGTVQDTSSVDFQIGSNQVNSIRWLGVLRQLFAGTPGSIFVARASSNDEAITPTNVTLPQLTSIGASSLQPINAAGTLLYMTRNNTSLRSIEFNPNSDAFTPVDVTLLAKHIFGRVLSVTTAAFQQDRQQILWMTRSDGVLIAVTYVPEQQVFAWHRHIVGGNFQGGNAVVESVAVIPSPNETHDQVWLTVKRTINGATVRHIEIMEDEWLSGVKTEMRFIDSAPAAYSGVAISTLSGLDHLEGETVQVFANGSPHPDRVVSSGSITLNADYTDVVAGLQYISELETLALEIPDPAGSSTGLVARIDHVVLRFYESLGGEIGPDVDNLDPLIFRSGADPMDASPPVFTGDMKIAFRGGFQREKSIVLRQTQPLPMNLLSMNVIVSTGQR